MSNVRPKDRTKADLVAVVEGFVDMLRLDDVGEDIRAWLHAEASSIWPFAMPPHDGGSEPAGLDHFDRVLLRDITRAFEAYRKRRDGRLPKIAGS